MDEHVPEALVTDYESSIESLELPDPDDRHVLAAAIAAGVETIVTSNLRDFPQDILAAFRIEAVHPDAFIVRLFNLDPDEIRDAAREHRASLKNPPKTVAEYLASLEAVGLVQTAARLRDRPDDL